MAKLKDLAQSFLQQRHLPTPETKNPMNAFNALFSVQDLSDRDSRVIEKIFVDGYEPGSCPEGSVDSDILEIKNITKELRAIRKQEMILIGERLWKAKQIFKRYKERSFREWIEFTFGSFKTGYNYLAYYDLYRSIPENLKETLKEMPAKAAYILASKKAPIEKKSEIIREHSRETASNLITIIRNRLGGDRSKPEESVIDKLLTEIEKDVAKLFTQSDSMNEMQRQKVLYLIEQLQCISSNGNSEVLA